MNSNIRHFNISFKTVAIILVLAIFATLIPAGGLNVSYAEEPYSSFLDPDVFDLSDYPDTSEAGEMLQSGRVSEYERIALEKLGKPATVENINPYRRSDVSYQRTELANAFSRDYALNNGNFTRLVFGMPVNYKTSEGIWEKINLTLHEHEGRLETADTPYSLSFASSCETANDLISIGYSGVSLSLSPQNASAKPLEAQYEQIPHKEDELLTENPCENGTVVYEEYFAKSDVSPAASLEYTVKPYEIKENIVISEGGFFQYSYSFKLSTDALSIETKDGSVVLYDESGKAVFRLSAALMKDAKNDCSDQVFLTLEETEEGYIIAVSADADWINAEGRVFPVKIDPTIEISYSGEDEAFDAVYVDGMVRDSGIAIGCNTKTYIKFDPDMLSGLPSGATVTHASFAASFYSMQLLPDDIYVRSEKISGSWSPVSVLIGYSAPSVAASYSDLTDSANVNVSGAFPVYAAFELDITPVIYDCFSIGDNGLVLSTDCLSSMPSGHYTVAMTALQITYTDNSGINGYQSSHTVSIDGSGTAYIKDINGDVTFIHPVISTKGEILPVDIDMVYNASFIGTATDTYYGNGWRPSIIQTMKEETVTDINSDTYTYYVLTDGTGGKHYYTHSSGNIYVADENPFYKYNAQARSLDYNDGTVAYFNAYGYLEAVENAYGDSYTVFYIGSTPKIDYVLDGCGSEIDFIYTGSLLSAAENPDCPLRGVSFSYTGNILTAINSSAGERSTFAYNSNGTMSRFGYRKTSADTCDRQYVQFGYTAGLPDVISSVSSVIKYAVNDSGLYDMRDIAYISYGDHTEYGYRYGSLSADAIYTEYIYFDRSGRTTAVFDSLGNASGSEYEGGSLSKMNLLSGETNTVMTDGNLVKDFSEKTSDWTAYSVTGNGSLYDEYSSSHFGLGRYGGNYFKLTSDSQTSEVYAKYPVPSAVPGKTYTLAVDIDPSDLSGSGGVVLGAMYSLAGMWLKVVSPEIECNTDQRAQYTFEIPSFAAPGSVYILVGVKNLSGDFYFDLVSLTEGACDRPVNMVSDSGFYYGTSAWSIDGSFTPSVVTSDRIRSIRIPGSIGETRRISQVLPTTVTDGNYLIVSGFGKGKAVSSGKFGIIVDFGAPGLMDRELLFSSNTSEWQYITAIIEVPDTHGGSSVTVKLVNDSNYTDAFFGGVTVDLVNSIGEYINRSLYTYDEDYGLLLTEKTFSGEVTEYTYDHIIHNRLSSKKHTDVRKNETSTVYTYDSSRPYEIVSTVESLKPSGSNQPTVQTSTNNSYNAKGNLTESVTLFTHDSPSVEVAHRLNVYSSDGRFLEKEADSAGRFITYSYSAVTGDLLSVTDGDGNVTTYTYDSYGRLTGESCGGSSFGLTYGQTGTGISRTTFSYSVVKNAAGDQTGFEILDSNGDTYRTFATYTYGGALGGISKLTYGNGQEKYYGYDSLGNLQYIAFSPNATVSTAAFAWYYDSNGNVIKTVDRSDPSNPLTKQYSYDQKGNINQILSSDGNRVYFRQSDTFNQSYERFVTAGTGEKCNTIVETDEAERESVASGYGGTRTINYDELGRVSSFSHSAGTSSSTKTYSYVNRNVTASNGNQTYTLKNHTALVSSETCSVSGVPTLSYTYYANGKIESISENGIQTQKFEYDALGQLIREDNKKLNGGNGYTIRYIYDNCGNIIGKTVFSYCPSIDTNNLMSMGTLVSFPIYGYDSVFKDNLATYYGISLFSYDNAGNPLTYYSDRSYTMTWTRGNKLSTVTPQGSTSSQSFLYDADGLRTAKISVSGGNQVKRINYFRVGTTLKTEWAEDGSYEIIYIYDANGRVCGFTYSQNGGNATLYRYIRNAQGDVTHIINISGAIVASYTYDTWGKLESIKNGSGVDITSDTTSIGYINPIRYRGYYYDSETGFYYLQSRYYDPCAGRFLNADSQLHLEDGSLGTNLYCYCGNDPVSGCDPEGTWNWGKFFSGLRMVGAAVICIASVAVSVASCGTLTPLMAVTACVTVAAAVCYAAEGVAETVEAGTGYNFIRDTIFNGNEAAYEASKSVLETIMQVGSSIVGTGTGECFIAGTKVATETGPVEIEKISAGDIVFAYDETSGNVGLRKVVRTFVKEADELIHVTIKGKETVCTNEHPFYSPVKGWTAACKLRAGDILVTVNGEYVVVEKIQHEILESPVKVYNFEVEGYHTYYVGDEGVLVHNDCNHGSAWAKVRRSYWIKQALKYMDFVNSNVLSDSGKYFLTPDNISSMLKGKAPMGIDGHKVQLHHLEGIVKNMLLYKELTFTEHFANFKELHYWLWS